MQRKKSRFWLFVWSLMPGAGEMYLGFMKMGISLMIGFMGLIALVALTNIGALAVLPVTMWFYSFFHANNLAGLDEHTFMAMEDRLLFGLDEWSTIEELGSRMTGKKKTVVAGIFIIIGVITLWQAVFNLLCDIFGWDNAVLSQIYYFMRDDLPRFVVGIAIIWAGLLMIRGRKEEIILGEEDRDVQYGAPERRIYVEQNRQQDTVADAAGDNGQDRQ